MKTDLSRALLGVATVLSMLGASAACAQDYPRKPIRWIIPYPPGGSNDVMARIMSPPMSESLGQQIVVENRGGGAAIPGVDAVAKAPPDGYTMGLATIAFSANPSLFKTLPFDPSRDFALVSLISISPMVLSLHPSVPAKSMDQLIALAKAKPGMLNYGSAGNGSANHLAAEVFKQMTGINIVHVPYKGGGPGVAALVAGEIPMMFTTIASSHPFIQSGKLIPLAVSNINRSAALPGVPTVSELGLTGYSVNEWQVLIVPAGTPSNVIDRLHKEVVKALAIAAVKERFPGIGLEAIGGDSKEAAAFVKAELDRWARVIPAADIHLD
jgi:tripartite-type tricarboxylate transporter receptor subunit TctC